MSRLFVLKEKTRLQSEPIPSENEFFDHELQIWIDREAALPVVCSKRSRSSNSTFGETTLTATAEGADQPERSRIEASTFGETTLTETSVGTDQSESTTFFTSQFGETTVTKAQEGTDCVAGSPNPYEF